MSHCGYSMQNTISQFIKPKINPDVDKNSSFPVPMPYCYFTKLLRAVPVNAVAATVTLQSVTITAVTPGVAGNSISITLVDPTDDGALAITVNGRDISVSLAQAAGSITTTATQLVAALNADAAVAALAVASGSGASALTAAAKTSLTGGVDGTAAPEAGIYYWDGTYFYVALAQNTKTDTNWVKVAYTAL